MIQPGMTDDEILTERILDAFFLRLKYAEYLNDGTRSVQAIKDIIKDEVDKALKR